MNRVILIGNGFDIAHGLESKYTQFMADYLIEIIKKANNSIPSFIENDLLSIKVKGGPHRGKDFVDFISNLDSLEKIFNDPYIKHNLKRTKPSVELVSSPAFTLEIKSDFLIRILSKHDIPNWIDIEKEYYDYLFHLVHDEALKSKKDKIIELNNHLGQIKNWLENYINKINEKFDFELLKQTETEFTKEVERLLTPSTIYQSGEPLVEGELLLLNFNYTNTLDHYMPHFIENKISSTQINIHGAVHENSIILGFGHVEDDRYQSIINSNIIEAQRQLKIFEYNLNGRLREVNNFLKKGLFEIYIFGHSCGSSDGTMLRRLFEHEGCGRVTLYYHSSEEYTNKLIEIRNRCLSDEIHNKLSTFSDKNCIPQLSN